MTTKTGHESRRLTNEILEQVKANAEYAERHSITCGHYGQECIESHVRNSNEIILELVAEVQDLRAILDNATGYTFERTGDRAADLTFWCKVCDSALTWHMDADRRIFVKEHDSLSHSVSTQEARHELPTL